MTWLQIIVLAVVQGLTEFLPISSSGHLILVPAFAGWTDQGLPFDVAVHFGSLGAVCVFFRNDIAGLIRGAGDVLAGRSETLQARMAWCIGLGTIPAAIAGLLLAGWIAANLRNPMIVVATLAGYGVLMALVDRFAPRNRDISSIRIRDALIIGTAQALALVPGSHLWPQRFARPGFSADDPDNPDSDLRDYEPFPDIDADPEGYGVVSWDLAPGDCIAFDANVIHGGSGRLAADRELKVFATNWLGDDVVLAVKAGGMDIDVRAIAAAYGLKEGDPPDCPAFPLAWPRG